ncbi:MAG: hypothetical protein LC770_07615 [Acidobacteria bacterium]|nr:hypothetical protein [Acidobacteriota bacterium]
MQSQFIRKTTFFVAVLVAISFCLIDADAQTRKRRRPRRVVRPVITNPVITAAEEQKAPESRDKIISTADETPDAEADETTQTSETKPKKGKTAAKPSADAEDMQQTINSLSNQVNRLNDKLGQMQETAFGSTRPEEAREARRRKLESDRSRLLAQMKILETSRVRLESAVATADAEVDLLRRRLEVRRSQNSASSEPTESRPANTRRKPE